MNKLQKEQVASIVKHVEILNCEMGNVLNDIKWIKRVGYYMATIMTAMLIGGVLL